MKRNQVGLSILDFIERGLFSRATLDVSKIVVVIDGRDEEWLPRCLCVELVIELEFRRVNGTETVDLLRGLGLRSVDLFRSLEDEWGEAFSLESVAATPTAPMHAAG